MAITASAARPEGSDADETVSFDPQDFV